MEKATVEVRLYALLREKGCCAQEMKAQTPREIMEQLEIEEDELPIVLQNGVSVELDAPLEEGDVLSLFPPVGGG